jgi:hypothetical protein
VALSLSRATIRIPAAAVNEFLSAQTDFACQINAAMIFAPRSLAAIMRMRCGGVQSNR